MRQSSEFCLFFVYISSTPHQMMTFVYDPYIVYYGSLGQNELLFELNE